MVSIGSLFSGIGGLELGLEIALEAKTLWQVEKDKHALAVLKARFSDVPKYEDIKTVSYRSLSEVDLICGGFPCQDTSDMGHKRGLSGERSSLVFEAIRLVREMRPKLVVLENVMGFLRRGHNEVCEAFEKIGYETNTIIIDATVFGASQRRKRVFVLAHSHNKSSCACLRQEKEKALTFDQHDWRRAWASARSELVREFSGFPNWLDGCPLRERQHNYTSRMRMIGNSCMPQMSFYVGKIARAKGLI